MWSKDAKRQKGVWLLRCATAAAECIEEPVQALELPKVWRDLDVHVGNTGLYGEWMILRSDEIFHCGNRPVEHLLQSEQMFRRMMHIEC